MPPQRPKSAPGLFEEILSAPDRERVPGAREVISYRDDDEPELLSAIAARARSRIELRRRGVWHGSVAVLEDGEPRRQRPPTGGELRRRWDAAQPILLPGAACAGIEAFRGEIASSLRLEEQLRRPGGLARWMRAKAEDLPADLAVSPRRARAADPQRDIEKVHFAPLASHREGAIRDLWAKSSWLSDHREDDSVRLRFSFGREGLDDASDDLPRHALVAEVAGALLPESQILTTDNELLNLLETFIGEPVLFTQHIAYWNGPEGGALFHHDAFPADEPDLGQRGVVFSQLSGSTVWLALSIGELAERVRELAAYLVDGQLPWVVDELFPRAADLDAFLRRVNDHERLMRELALPGCGSLGPVVNRGPEFTSLLADAGHALVLEPGDVLLLPNHGYRRTAMHSVFCASHLSTYGLSLAVRGARPRPEPVLEHGLAVEAGPRAAGAPPNGAKAARRERARRRKQRGGQPDADTA